ncbi:ras guanyl-nucleotide exchange factor [Moniliophthora roreri MCA 2997]|uniref:Ras guanyl-nucleotide exchange factor n=2 Tax=Moniliophthora roreri TaxID=221103 RepID=V2XYR8_MONRO|nr:ras guanyl-nucleotide exchange factor [Moniliophthora roreri MCA 2997]
MSSTPVQAYRSILRELKKASVQNGKISRALSFHFRALASQANTESKVQELQDCALFLHSQREYNVLLQRYNPLVDYTAEERIEATARRVGLNMPKTHTAEGQSQGIAGSEQYT